MQFEKFHRFCGFCDDDDEPPIQKKCKKFSAQNCCVSNCNVNDDTLSYHQFPKDSKKIVGQNPNGERIICSLRKVWEDRVGVDQKITKYSKVCSRHFRDEDYGSNSKGRCKRLKSVAVPCLFLPEENAFITFRKKFEPLCEITREDANKNIMKKCANAVHNNNYSKVECMTKESSPKTNLENNNPKQNSQTVISENSKTDISSIMIDSSSENDDTEILIYEENKTLDVKKEEPHNNLNEINEIFGSEYEEKLEIDKTELIETLVPKAEEESPGCDTQTLETDISDLFLMTSFEVEELRATTYI